MIKEFLEDELSKECEFRIQGGGRERIDLLSVYLDPRGSYRLEIVPHCRHYTSEWMIHV